MADLIQGALDIPLSYEDVINAVGADSARMMDFIVPVTESEELVTQVVHDIRRTGYLLFLYGVPGIGKSTFINSLQWRKHIPVKKIIPIDVSNLSAAGEPHLKMRRLFSAINDIFKQEEQEFNPSDLKKSCIVIDYLESLRGENAESVRTFFQDLNGLLRKAPILIIWPVTERGDLEDMTKSASSFSSTLFHRRIPVIEFTGPSINDYPKIAKNTISFFNKGKPYYEFQFTDEDFDVQRQFFESLPRHKQIIRDYLKHMYNTWEERTGYVKELMATVPRPTEVWIIVCYPDAEDVVAQFSRKSYDVIDETWNADYRQLSAYAKNNSREADWTAQRLSLALSGVLNTKILYIPTNTLVSCVSAYSQDAGIPISKQDFLEMGVPPRWLQKSEAQRSLEGTPLFLQLASKPPKMGKRRSGTIAESLETARPIFEKINQHIAKEGSDQPFNKALALAP